MSSRSWVGLFLLVVAATIHSHSVAVKNLRIDDLIKASDLIAVVEVADVRAISPAPPVVVHNQLLQADSYSADLQVKKIIKGTAGDRVIVKYALPLPFVGYRGLQRGTRLVFLRQEQDHYGVADPYYPDFPAVLSISGNEATQSSEGRYATIVVREMVAVIASANASPAEKSQILQVADALPPNEEVVAAFKEGVANAQEPDLRQRLEGELIRFGDTTELPEVAHLLLTNTATADQRMWLLYVIGNRVNDRRAIPALEPLLRSGESSIRVAAVEALWHIADPNTLTELLRSLQDPDEQVRFYSVRAFSDIANEPGWGGPSESEFRKRQQEYLEHWQDWARVRMPQ